MGSEISTTFPEAIRNHQQSWTVPARHWVLPLGLCLLWLLLCLPTVFNNLNDTDLVAWFSHDEIYLLDLLQYYRTGERNEDTFQGLADHGMYLRTLAFILGGVEGAGLSVGPGAALGVIRAINLTAGLLAIVVLWRLLLRHFGFGASAVIGVLGLALSPSFIWHLDFAKPEPLVSLLFVCGLDYSLRIFDDPSQKHLILATLFAVLAALIKMVGIFLLPGLALAVWKRREAYLAEPWKVPAYLFLLVAVAWVAFSPRFAKAFVELVGAYGHKASVHANPVVALVARTPPERVAFLLKSLALIPCVAAAYLLVSGRLRARAHSPVRQGADLMLMIGGVFTAWMALLGSVWLFDPKTALIVYGRMVTFHTECGSGFAGTTGILGDTFSVLAYNLSQLAGLYLYVPGEWYGSSSVEFSVVSDQLGVGGLVAVAGYAVKEGGMLLSAENRARADMQDWKRWTVLTVSAAYCSLLLYGCAHPQHFVPVVGLLFFLAAYGIFGFPPKPATGSTVSWGGAAVLVVLCLTLVLNAKTSLEWRMNKLGQRSGSSDLVWEMAAWWKANVPAGARILAGSPYRVYVPAEHSNVVRFRDLNKPSEIASLRDKIAGIRPDFLTYNAGRGLGKEALPDLDRILPGHRFELAKEFHGKHFTRSVSTDDRILVYRVKKQGSPS